MSKQPPGKGHRRKHITIGGGKHHHKTGKHNPHHQRKPAGWGQAPVVTIHVKMHHGHHHPHGHRGFSPGADVACCSAQALGTLVGWDSDDVLALYWRTASDPDSGATIRATLEAWRERDLNPRLPGYEPGALTELRYPAPLILGVTLPEPHALAVKPDGTWWSWGEPFDPADWPDLVVEEAWALCL